LARAGSVADADGRLRPRLDQRALEWAVGLVPKEWLTGGDGPETYVEYLCRRLTDGGFAEEAERARTA
jgi:hypothetical protein